MKAPIHGAGNTSGWYGLKLYIRRELGLATDIGEHELETLDSYEGVSDEELLAQLETLTVKYKEKLTH